MSLFDVFFTAPQVEYHPKWPQWLRWVGWAWRNPLPGLTRGWKGIPYLVFVYDCAPWSIHKGAPEFIPPEARSTAPTWNPVGGWLYCKLAIPGKVRHWISYRGKHIECYVGTKPSTGTGPIVALRKANARGI